MSVYEYSRPVLGHRRSARWHCSGPVIARSGWPLRTWSTRSWKSENIPATLCFYTEGVRWLTKESPILAQLAEIHKRGADIVACKACLAEAGLLDRVALGRLDSQDHIDDILRHAEHTVVV